MPIIGPNGQEIPPSTMNQATMDTLGPEAFADATAADMSAMPADAMSGMTAELMERVPPEAMGGMRVEHMNFMRHEAMEGIRGEQMGEMPNEAMGGMNSSMMREMPSEAMQGMDASMMREMPPEAMQGMDPSMMREMPPEAMQGIDAEMMTAMPANTMDTMTDAQTANIQATEISSAEQAVPPTDDGGLGALGDALGPPPMDLQVPDAANDALTAAMDASQTQGQGGNLGSMESSSLNNQAAETLDEIETADATESKKPDEDII